MHHTCKNKKKYSFILEYQDSIHQIVGKKTPIFIDFQRFLWFLGPYTTSTMAVRTVYRVYLAWRCIIIVKTSKNTVLFLSNKTVFHKLPEKHQFFNIFEQFLWFLGPYTTSPMAVRTIYRVYLAWRCIIIVKTSKNTVLFLSNKTVLTKLSEKTPIFQRFLAIFVIFGPLYYPPWGR